MSERAVEVPNSEGYWDLQQNRPMGIVVVSSTKLRLVNSDILPSPYPFPDLSVLLGSGWGKIETGPFPKGW